MPPVVRRPRTLDCDLLVLGAGLAGMRAAIAARQAAPRLRVLLASPFARPTGSSFANRNNALGVQAPAPEEAQAFADEVLRLAPPGLVLRPLALALAQDAQARLAELQRLGLAFRRDASGAPLRFTGCFSAIRRALVFDGLAQAGAAFRTWAGEAGVTFLPGFEALALARDASGRVAGACLRALRGGERLNLRAGAVVAALGGPAPLYARRICGPGGFGLSYGLLASAGARLANAPFLQFFWSEAASLDFVNPADLVWPEALAPLAEARRTHCPMGHGTPDAALDQALLERMGPDGFVRAEHRERGLLDLVLAAHAGNGGALIDTEGRTTVPGLYACGECATGMHGANRLGGGMALAALVFGARAGDAAVREHRGTAGIAWPDPGPEPDPAREAAWLKRLRRGMQRFGLPRAEETGETGAGRRRFAKGLRSVAAAVGLPARRRLLARSALAVLDGEP